MIACASVIVVFGGVDRVIVIGTSVGGIIGTGDINGSVGDTDGACNACCPMENGLDVIRS
jgi:hypothetical protein